MPCPECNEPTREIHAKKEIKYVCKTHGIIETQLTLW